MDVPTRITFIMHANNRVVLTGIPFLKAVFGLFHRAPLSPNANLRFR
jgi:hypothetical protein